MTHTFHPQVTEAAQKAVDAAAAALAPIYEGRLKPAVLRAVCATITDGMALQMMEALRNVASSDVLRTTELRFKLDLVVLAADCLKNSDLEETKH